MKLGIVFQQPFDQVIIFFQRGQLKGGDAVDGDDDRFVMADSAVMAQVGFGFTQRNHFHRAP